MLAEVNKSDARLVCDALGRLCFCVWVVEADASEEKVSAFEIVSETYVERERGGVGVLGEVDVTVDAVAHGEAVELVDVVFPECLWIEG